jgi:probable phosphoglycerate mutase
VPLNATGRAQAEAAARLLAAQPIAAVWTSPLSRARETAAIVAAPHCLDVRPTDAFAEMGHGVWEGLTVDEVRARFPEAYARWRETPHVATWEGAEPLADVRRRVLAGLATLRQEHDDQTVVIVAHGISSRVLILEALGLDIDRLWALQVSATGISELEFRDDWTAVHRMNTLLHLDTVPVLG